MVAPQALSRSLWGAGAALAAGALLALALFGERPATHVGAFEPAGVMRHIPPQEIIEVEVASGKLRWRFMRAAAGWRKASATAPLPADAAAGIEEALRLLHNSAPERTLSGDDLAGSAAFGLEPPALKIAVKGRTGFSIAFGAANPLGLARYARVEGRDEVVLLPRYVADAWEWVVGLRAK